MIQHNKPTIGNEEHDAIIRVLNSGHLSQGQEVNSFENEFCKFIGLPNGHAVALSSGTASLFLSLWVLNSSGKKIAFPGYVCSAVRNAVGMVGGRECLIDNAKDSPNLSFDEMKKKSADVVIIPHMFGIPSQIERYQHVSIIEDCAQSLGAKINGKSVGTQGDVGIFSFYATKLMTTGGQGGMFVSKNKGFVDKVRDYREFDYRDDKKLRFNFQMTDIQAAVGREQLKKLPKFIHRREEIFKLYQESGLDLIDVKQDEQEKLKPVRYRAILKTNNPDKTISLLKKVNVESCVPVEDWELLDKSSNFKNAFYFTKNTVSLPIYPSLTNEEIETVLSVFN